MSDPSTSTAPMDQSNPLVDSNTIHNILNQPATGYNMPDNPPGDMPDTWSVWLSQQITSAIEAAMVSMFGAARRDLQQDIANEVAIQ